ncbi:MAG: hypothetical protein ACHQ2Y_01460 [Candidatus Lutacidiplasmatales archaeon]
MNSSALPTVNGEPWAEPRPHRWLFGGLAVMFVLIGVAILLSVASHGWTMMGDGGHPFFIFPFGLLWGLFWLLVLFWLISWAFRWAFWGGYGRHYRRANRFDPAYGIARERYARGEITREQFDQIARDLGHS